VTFATPYAIFIFQQYGKSIPLELDESARIDGASPPQVYFRIYLPLMAPALGPVRISALGESAENPVFRKYDRG
jgi:multiple sugar transport system permease protein